jgi:hypothetical protein
LFFSAITDASGGAEIDFAWVLDEDFVTVGPEKVAGFDNDFPGCEAMPLINVATDRPDKRAADDTGAVAIDIVSAVFVAQVIVLEDEFLGGHNQAGEIAWSLKNAGSAMRRPAVTFTSTAASASGTAATPTVAFFYHKSTSENGSFIRPLRN